MVRVSEPLWLRLHFTCAQFWEAGFGGLSVLLGTKSTLFSLFVKSFRE